jgi:hypothetical protein
VWPFLVGRGRREGYQTLLAPSFLIERDMHETLSDATPSVRTGVLGRARVTCPGLGLLTLAYTTDEISTGSIGSVNGVGDLTDEHGRPLEILYGVVSKEPLSDMLTVADLQRARDDALEAYGSFLAHEDDFSVGVSHQYLLPRQQSSRRYRQSDGSPAGEGAPRRSDPRRVDRDAEGVRPTHKLRAHHQPDTAQAPQGEDRAAITAGRRHHTRRTRLHPRSREVVAVIALAAVTLGSALWLLGRGPTPSVKIIDTSATPANSDTCDSAIQLRLQASLTAAGQTRIRYRWLPTGKLTAGSIPEESVTLRRNPQTITDIREASAGPYRLVIDDPGSQQSSQLTCRSAEASAATSDGPTPTGQFPEAVEP